MPNRMRSSSAEIGALIFLLVATFTAGCAIKGEIPTKNIVMAHARGWAVNPARNFHALHREAFDRYLDAMVAELAHFCRDEAKEHPGRPCRVVFFAHGGMNSRKHSIERAIQLQKTIKRAHAFPIFLNWHSSFPSTWWHHLARVRKGQFGPPAYVLMSPYFFANDQIRAVPEAPAAWVAEIRHALPLLAEGNGFVEAYADLVESPIKPAVNDITNSSGELQDDRAGLWEKHGSWLGLPLTLPFKVLSAPFIVQPWGSGAWDVMLRRTDVLFRTEAAFDNKVDELGTQAAQGAAFAHFFARFQNEFIPRLCDQEEKILGHADDIVALNSRATNSEASSGCPAKIELSIVGHSMGSIIINEILRHVPRLEFSNIVYMGAAARVRDYRDAVLPYLRSHPHSNMYHLVLHPVAEVKECGILDLSPRGSLLVWIDNYFSNPVSPLDRTVGRFSNLAPELRFTDEDVRSRVHLKVFRVGNRVHRWNPQKHGDFGNFPYWDPRFWDPDVESLRGAPQRFKSDTQCALPSLNP